jgi:hypothetical protein
MPDTLAAMVRAKYPDAYTDLSDIELEAKVKAKYPGTYDDLPSSSVAGAHPEAKISAAPAGFGERMLSAAGPAIRGAGDVTGVNRILEATGAVDPGRLTGEESNPRDASTRTGAAVGGGVAMGAEAVTGLVNLAKQGGVPAVMRGVAALTVVPAVKYELTKQALEAMHFPSAAAIPIALMVSGYQRGKGPSVPPEAATAAPSAVDITESAQAAKAARANAFGTPQMAPEAPAAPQAQAPTPAPVASPVPTSPAVAAPEAAAVATAPISTPDAFKAALNAFDTAKVAPQAAEVNNAAMLIKRGVAPDEALKTVLGNRPPAPANPAAELAKRLGTPSEAEMNADMAARARRGQKSLMPKYGGESAQAPQATLAQPVAPEPPPVAPTPAPEPAPAPPEPTPTPEPASAPAAKPKRAVKAKATVVDAPPAAADTPAAAAERVIDVAGAKTGKDVQGRVISALTEELANAQQAAKFSTIEFSPNAGKTYGYGRVMMDGQPVAAVDKYGKINWLDDSPAYTTAQGKRVAAESTHADISLEGRMDEKTPGQIAREATAKVAQAVGQENGAGMLRVQIPGDGTFTVPRNPHAIGELIRRLSAGGPSIWQGVGDVKFSAPKVGPEIPKATW